jgi:hypothetical protein
VLDGIDLRGKRTLVTLVPSVVGVETTRAIQARGAQILDAARGRYKPSRALMEMGAPEPLGLNGSLWPAEEACFWGSAYQGSPPTDGCAALHESQIAPACRAPVHGHVRSSIDLMEVKKAPFSRIQRSKRTEFPEKDTILQLEGR